MASRRYNQVAVAADPKKGVNPKPFSLKPLGISAELLLQASGSDARFPLGALRDLIGESSGVTRRPRSRGSMNLTGVGGAERERARAACARGRGRRTDRTTRRRIGCGTTAITGTSAAGCRPFSPGFLPFSPRTDPWVRNLLWSFRVRWFRPTPSSEFVHWWRVLRRRRAPPASLAWSAAASSVLRARCRRRSASSRLPSCGRSVASRVSSVCEGRREGAGVRAT